MIRRPTLSVAVLLLAAGTLTMTGCTSLRGGSEAPSVFGTWQFTMFNPSQGTLTGRVTITEEEDGTYTGRLTVPDAEMYMAIMTIQSLEIDGPSFVLTAAADDSQFTITAVIDGDVMTGENDLSGVAIYTMDAVRVVE